MKNVLEDAQQTKMPAKVQENDERSTDILTHTIAKLENLGLHEPLAPCDPWPLYMADRKRMRLFEDLNEEMSTLAALFPLGTINGSEEEAARLDADKLIQRSQGQDDVFVKEAANALLLDATSEEDYLSNAVRDLLGRNSGGHTYGRLKVSDDGIVTVGDYIDPKFSGPIAGAPHTYRDMKVSGSAKAHFGNRYGGSIFDD